MERPMKMQKIILSPNGIELNGVSLTINQELTFRLKKANGKYGIPYVVSSRRLLDREGNVYAVTFEWFAGETDQKMTFEVTKSYQEVEFPVEE